MPRAHRCGARVSVLDPKSARARLLGFVVRAGHRSTYALAPELAEHRRAIGRTARMRASYALSWLRRAGMIQRTQRSDGRRGAWEPTEYGRAVLRSMLDAVPEPAEGATS